MPETLIVKCNKCSQKIALPYDYDSPIFLCPRCQNQMNTPAQILAPKAEPAPPTPATQTTKPQQAPQEPIQPTAPAPTYQDNQPPKPQPTQTPPPQHQQPAPTAPTIPTMQKTPEENFQEKNTTQTAPENPQSGRATRKSPYPKQQTKTSPPPSAKSSKKGTRAELVEKIGERKLKEHIEAYIENTLSAQPESKEAFLRRLVKSGIDTQTAAALIAYAEKSDEGKEIAIGTSKTVFIYGMAALIGGIAINAATVVIAGVVIKFLAIIPAFGLIAVVNSGQKILSVKYPIFNNQLFQLLIFLIFIAMFVGFFYFALR